MLIQLFDGKDAPLRSAFEKMNRDKLWDTVFPAIGKMAYRGFVKYFSDKWIIASVDESTGEWFSLGWIWGIVGEPGERATSMGYISFSEMWKTLDNRRVAQFTLAEFARLFKLKVAFGLARGDNRLVVNFTKHLGFKEVGIVPLCIVSRGKLIDGILTYREFSRREYAG